jgi:hypothetical protein
MGLLLYSLTVKKNLSHRMQVSKEINGEEKERTGEILGVKPHVVELMHALKKDYGLTKRFLSICANCPIIRYGESIVCPYHEVLTTLSVGR